MSPVALTFDDGPHPELTPRVLEALRSSNVIATFFVQGDRLVERPEIAQAAVAAGHSVQAHCFAHRSHHELSEQETTTDIERLLEAMARSKLTRPLLWRPPYGDIAPHTHRVAARLGLRLITWTVETCDWARDSATAILSELLAEGRPASRLEPDAIVLMHDTAGSHTVELVGLLADEVRRRGWSLGLIGDAPFTPERPWKACR